MFSNTAHCGALAARSTTGVSRDITQAANNAQLIKVGTNVMINAPMR
jgi:hypothetical protein